MNQVPTLKDFQRGCRAYEAKEKRDAMYKIATFLVGHFWGKPDWMADSIGVLLRTWNQAFYRWHGLFDFQRLEETIAGAQHQLKLFRTRNIISYSTDDDPIIKLLFNKFLLALQGVKKGTGSRWQWPKPFTCSHLGSFRSGTSRSPMHMAAAMHGIQMRSTFSSYRRRRMLPSS